MWKKAPSNITSSLLVSAPCPGGNNNSMVPYGPGCGARPVPVAASQKYYQLSSHQRLYSCPGLPTAPRP
jgi:hypothetical protein